MTEELSCGRNDTNHREMLSNDIENDVPATGDYAELNSHEDSIHQADSFLVPGTHRAHTAALSGELLCMVEDVELPLRLPVCCGF